MHNFKLNKKQRGLTIIELLIASALGIVVILGVTNSMMTLSLSSNVQRSHSDLQSTADLGLSYIASRMRNSLSSPCNQMGSLSKVNVNNLIGGTGQNAMDIDDADEASQLIRGHGISLSQQTFVLPGMDTTVGAGVNAVTTDDITIMSANDKMFLDGESGITSASSAISTLDIDGIFSPSSGDEGIKSSTSPTAPPRYSLYALTDCENLDVFRADRKETSGKTELKTLPGTGFSINYRGSEKAMVSRVSISTMGVNADGNLFNRANYGGVAGNTLMGGVELIRVLFAVDTNDDGVTDRYVTSSQINGLNANVRILTAEVYIMVRANDMNMSLPASYSVEIPNTSADLPNTGVITMDNYTFNDRIMRKVFSRSVTFRNKASL